MMVIITISTACSSDDENATSNFRRASLVAPPQ